MKMFKRNRVVLERIAKIESILGKPEERIKDIFTLTWGKLFNSSVCQRVDALEESVRDFRKHMDMLMSYLKLEAKRIEEQTIISPKKDKKESNNGK